MAKKPPVLKINLRIARGGTPQAQIERILDRIKTELERGVADEATTQLFNRLARQRDQIIADIEADLDRFGRQVASFFTTIRSPDTTGGGTSNHKASRTVSIALNRQMLGDSGIVRSNNPRVTNRTLLWETLSPKTTANKRWKGSRSPLTFFADSRDLRQALKVGLGEAYADLVNPRIEITDERGPRRRKEKHLTVKALLNPQFRSTLFSDFRNTGVGAKSERLVLSYLKKASAERALAKLSNTDRNHDGPYRPFLQPALAWWVLSTLPSVFEKAVRGSVSDQRIRSRAKIYGNAQIEGH